MTSFCGFSPVPFVARYLFAACCVMVACSAPANAHARPADGSALEQRATAFFRTGQLSKARDLLQRAVKVRPRSIVAWSMLAAACPQLGQAREALHAHRQVVKLDPTSSRAPFTILAFWKCVPDFGESANYLGKACRQRPDDVELVLPPAHDLFMLGQTVEGMMLVAGLLSAAGKSYLGRKQPIGSLLLCS